jgi:DnaK suppressor protein
VAKKPLNKPKKTAAKATTQRPARPAKAAAPGLDGKKPKPAKVARPPTNDHHPIRRPATGTKRAAEPAAPRRKAAGPGSARKGHPGSERPSAADLAAQAAEVATYLSPEDVEELRTLLMEKRSQLVGDVGTLQDEAQRGSRREAAGDLSSMPVHMADLGTANYELEFTLGLLEGGRAHLQEIEEALERIRKGVYGVCVATGKPIGKARLKAKPWAKYSYEYAMALEKGQHRGL